MLIMLAGAIISRSVYLRRRQRQLIASGRWLPSGQREKGEVNLKKRPRMFDAHIAAVLSANDVKQWELISVRCSQISPAWDLLKYDLFPSQPLCASYNSAPAVILPASEIAHQVEPTGAAATTLTTGIFLPPRRILSPVLLPPEADTLLLSVIIMRFSFAIDNVTL